MPILLTWQISGSQVVNSLRFETIMKAKKFAQKNLKDIWWEAKRVEQ